MITKRNLLRNKKAVLGIETLIIFIAMILVAAVAAGVLIRTSGILQQRAFAVSSETITRVATGMDTVQITGNVHTGEHHIREIELLLRLGAGSEVIQIGEVGLTYSSNEIFTAASLSHPDISRQIEVDIIEINTTERIQLYNLDNDPTDSRDDDVKFIEDIDGNHGLQFILSSAGTINVSLEVNLTDNNNVYIENLPISKDGEEDIYGYIDLQGSFGEVTDFLDSSSNDHNFTLVIKKYPNVCRFDLLRPDMDFCIIPRIGNHDSIFQAGELLVFLFRLSASNKLTPDTRAEISLIPAKAIVSTISFYTREAFPTYKIHLWP